MRNQTRKRGAVSVVLSLGILALLQSSAQATIGLSTRFIDVTLEHLEVGKIYNLRQLKNVPYTIRNRGNANVEVEIQVSRPTRNEMFNNYEPVPDPTWIQIVPNKFVIPAGQTAYAELIIQVPNSPDFVGKHYQAVIWAGTVGTGMFGAGVQSRLRFSTGPGPETLKGEAKKKAMMTLDFDVTPQEIYVAGLEPGKTYNINKLALRKLKITNRAETPLQMKFNSEMCCPGPLASEDYEPAPDPKWLKFSPGEAKIKGDRVVTVDPILTIPAGDEHRGKKYVFLMKADLVMGVELEVYSKIFVTIKEK